MTNYRITSVNYQQAIFYAVIFPDMHTRLLYCKGNNSTGSLIKR